MEDAHKQLMLVLSFCNVGGCVTVCLLSMYTCTCVCAHTVRISVNRHHDSLQESSIQHVSVAAANAIISSLFQAEPAEEEQGCFFFMRTSARDSL